MEGRTGVPTVPWVSVKPLSRTAIEAGHSERHHPSTWDRSAGRLPEFANRAASNAGAEGLVGIYEREKKIFSVC